MKHSAALLFAFVGLLTLQVSAATLTSTFQFNASGSIGSQSFTNASITLTTVSDTANCLANNIGFVAPNGNYSIANEAATISISGVGTFQFTAPAQTVISVLNMDFDGNLTPSADNNGEIEIYFFAGSARIGSFNGSRSLPWNMLSSFGPLASSSYNISGWNAEPVSTTGGAINFSDVSTGAGSFVFQAIVTPTVAVTPTQLNLSYQSGGALPVGVLQVSGLGSPGALTASASSSGNWLSVNPASTTATTGNAGTTPLTVNISPSALTAGSYSGSVSVTQNAATVIVPVNLTVTAPFVPSVYDVNGDGAVNVVDIQLIINAALSASGGSGKNN